MILFLSIHVQPLGCMGVKPVEQYLLVIIVLQMDKQCLKPPSRNTIQDSGIFAPCYSSIFLDLFLVFFFLIIHVDPVPANSYSILHELQGEDPTVMLIGLQTYIYLSIYSSIYSSIYLSTYLISFIIQSIVYMYIYTYIIYIYINMCI